MFNLLQTFVIVEKYFITKEPGNIISYFVKLKSFEEPFEVDKDTYEKFNCGSVVEIKIVNSVPISSVKNVKPEELCKDGEPHSWEYQGTDYHGSHKDEDSYKCRKCHKHEYRN